MSSTTSSIRTVFLFLAVLSSMDFFCTDELFCCFFLISFASDSLSWKSRVRDNLWQRSHKEHYLSCHIIYAAHNKIEFESDKPSHFYFSTFSVTNLAESWVCSIRGRHHMGVMKVWWSQNLLTSRDVVRSLLHLSRCPSDTKSILSGFKNSRRIQSSRLFWSKAQDYSMQTPWCKWEHGMLYYKCAF